MSVNKQAPAKAQATWGFIKAMAEAHGCTVEFERMNGDDLHYTMTLPLPKPIQFVTIKTMLDAE